VTGGKRRLLVTGGSRGRNEPEEAMSLAVRAALVLYAVVAVSSVAQGTGSVPSVKESAALQAGAGRLAGQEEATAVAGALAYLSTQGISASDIQYLRTIKDLHGTVHVRFAQRHRELPVLGGHLIVHLTNGGIRATDWYWRTAVEVVPIAAVTLPEAVAAAGEPGFVASIARSELAILPGDANHGQPELVWRIVTRKPDAPDENETLVNARTGQVIAKADTATRGYTTVRTKPPYTDRVEKTVGPTRMDAPDSYYYTEYGCFGSGVKDESLFEPSKWSLCSPGYSVIDAKGKYTTTGAPFKRKAATVIWGDFSLSGGDRATPAANVLFETHAVHTFFRNVFGWEGYAGNNDRMHFLVHVGMEGVAWVASCSCIQFGETLDGTSYAPVARDIVFHEWAHAVNENTAGMVAQTGYPETGGAAEANSDIWALLYTFDSNETTQSDKRGGWIGEMIFRENYANGYWLGLNKAIRYLDDPARDGISPPCYSATNATSLPAHRASLPLSHAMYLLVKGGTSKCDGAAINGIGYRDARSIWWHALITYFGPGATMSDVRRAAVQAAVDMFGSGSAQQQAVVAAFDSVRIPDGTNQ